MKFLLTALCALLLCGMVAAQDALNPIDPGNLPANIQNAPPSSDWPQQSLTKGSWELGVLTGAGTGLSYARDTHFFYAGARFGYILTRDHFSGWERGNFEWAVDVMPVYTVFTPMGPVYGGSFKPAIWKWNFTAGKRIEPYAMIAGGIVFTTSNIPPGRTSWVNFSPQAGIGARWFRKERQAMFMEWSIVHHSDAGLSNFNPGYNASVFVTIGYDWFKK
jgi:hypothetical protein